MIKRHKIIRLVALASLVTLVGMGCTKRPSEEELAKLDQARAAAESAEKKLAELRSERMELERVLSEKQAELGLHQEEIEDLKQKMATHGQ